MLPDVIDGDGEQSCTRVIKRLDVESKRYEEIERRLEAVKMDAKSIGPVEYVASDSNEIFIKELE